MSSLSEKRGSPLLVSLRASPRRQLSAGKEELDEVFVVFWHCKLSDQPLLFGFCVPVGSYQHELVGEAQAFVLQVPDPSWGLKVEGVSRRPQRGVDRFLLGGFEVGEAGSVDAPVVVGAAAFWECKVVKLEGVGDHVLVVGQVLRFGGKGADLTPEP